MTWATLSSQESGFPFPIPDLFRREFPTGILVARIHEKLQGCAKLAVARWLRMSVAMHNGPHACDQLHQRKCRLPDIGHQPLVKRERFRPANCQELSETMRPTTGTSSYLRLVKCMFVWFSIGTSSYEVMTVVPRTKRNTQILSRRSRKQ